MKKFIAMCLAFYVISGITLLITGCLGAEETKGAENESIASVGDGTAPKVYANGVEIGVLDSTENNIKLKFHKKFKPVYLSPLGKIKYEYEPFYYVETDCGGTPYLYYSTYPPPEDTFQLSNETGRLFSVKNPTDDSLPRRYYYLPPDTREAFKIHAKSYMENNMLPHRCYSYPPDDPEVFIVAFKLLPNDPAITGVPNDGFQPPITVEGRYPLTIIE